jgi:UDP-GlcNAc3NAcA epimerase
MTNMPLKIITIVGARPQFIKASAISRVFRTNYSNQVQELIVHTGQHYDHRMSDIFFSELQLPPPAYHLGISGGTHGTMTGRMLTEIETVLLTEKPDWILVYGDTNSTLAGALAAAKIQIPIAHVEAGLRSFNMRMPEEINRIVTDRLSTLLFCPTETAVANLQAEGITHGVHRVGDVMYDVSLFFRKIAREQSHVPHSLGLSEKGYALATCHRAENTDDPARLTEILSALDQLAVNLPVVLPLHPRTKNQIAAFQLTPYLNRLIVIEPLSFLDMQRLEQDASVILTDSGGVQKEAFFYEVPCVTMRDETEWVETVTLGWNTLVGASSQKILAAVSRFQHAPPPPPPTAPYGEANAAQLICQMLARSS